MVDPRLRTIVAAFASGQCPKDVLADLPGIGVCVMEDGENPSAVAVTTPNERGEFPVMTSVGIGGVMEREIPCRIGYHIPSFWTDFELPGIGESLPKPKFDWNWTYALAEPEPAMTA